MELQTVGTPLLWGGFTVFVLAMLAIDLGVFHRSAHEVRFKEAMGWTFVWIALSLIFNVLVYFWFGTAKALEFTTAYLIEKALSVDNVFVFVVIFSSFAVPKAYQHRVLFWGVLGALVLRAIFIFAGAALLQRFEWVMYIFGGILVFTGIRLMIQGDAEPHPEKNPIYKLGRKLIPSVPEYHGGNFFTVVNGKRFATPLLLVLLAVEATDLVFAVDSIPAIFAVSRDPFIVYTSNVFAILGLRALYFVLADIMDKFRYLNVGLALVLIFVGSKMLLIKFFHVPITVSLAVIVLLLGGAIVASLIASKRDERRDEAAG